MTILSRGAILGIVLSGAFLSARACFAAPTNDREFLAEKQNIILLAGERARTSDSDYQKLLKAAENGLRNLRENYQLRRSTPPTSLDGDVQQLVSVTQRIRLQRSRGADVPPDPAARALIARVWDDYAVAVEGIFQDILTVRRTGGSESQIYWEATSRFARLRDETENRAVFNPPEGDDSAESVFLRDELRLMQALEFSDRRTKGKNLRVELVAPEHASGSLDIAPFYASQGVLPQRSPREVAVLTVPVGSRTVTRRRSGENMILRTVEGKGVVYIGSSEKVLNFGYVLIPADTPYYFENTSGVPLSLEYIALSPS